MLPFQPLFKKLLALYLAIAALAGSQALAYDEPNQQELLDATQSLSSGLQNLNQGSDFRADWESKCGVRNAVPMGDRCVPEADLRINSFDSLDSVKSSGDAGLSGPAAGRKESY